MSETVRSVLAAATLTGLLAAMLLVGPLLYAGLPPLVVASILVGAVLLAGAYAYRRRDGRSGDLWNAIPNWQYEGRHVESGGLTRDEQARAIQEIHEEAADREER